MMCRGGQQDLILGLGSGHLEASFGRDVAFGLPLSESNLEAFADRRMSNVRQDGSDEPKDLQEFVRQ